MMNEQMIITALDKYIDYMYYAYNSDSLRSQDAKNLIDYIDTALQTLIFTDPYDNKALERAKNVSKFLNEAQSYALRLNYILCRAKTYEQAKTVYNLLGKLADMMFFKTSTFKSTCDHDYKYKILSDHTAVSVCSKCKKQVRA